MPDNLKLFDIGEDVLIRRLVAPLSRDPSVKVGPGDDCAVVETAGVSMLLKADAVVEDVHFLRQQSPALIGRKALARAVSDIGAMGGSPRHALVTLVLPSDLEVAFVEALYKGMSELADEFGVCIVGGETVRGNQIVISVALTGEVEKAVLRSTAQAGDAIFVTGHLGGSIRGRHLTFTPRVREGQWLAKHYPPTAMMDLSDGLAKDLPRIAEASGLEFVVLPGCLPCNPGCSEAEAWGDGEDYELVFTMADQKVEDLLRSWPEVFPTLALTRIGTMVNLGLGSVPNFTPTGWDHFAPHSNAE